MSAALVRWWTNNLLHAERKKWVMFQHGSVVIFIDREDSLNDTLEQDAINIMKRDGPVIPGTCSGDFSTITLDDGYVVTSHNPNLVTVAISCELKSELLDDLAIGMLLRGKRQDDAKTPIVVATSLNKTNLN